MPKLITLILSLLLYSTTTTLAEGDSTAVKKDSSGFDSFNAKMERLFKIIPVPIYSHSVEAGDVFGLAKFNLISLSKNDTISSPSKLS